MKILAIAYACEPGKGSEPGAGLAMVRLLARLGETWVLTRANNRASIEEWLPLVQESDRLHFVYVDLPRWLAFWKKGNRGIRAYYILWQLWAGRTASRITRQQDVAVVWHVTLANAWLGSVGGLFRGRFVFGPVGGGVSVPLGLLPTLGLRGILQEALRASVRGISRRVNPLARLACARAQLILLQNPETKELLPPRHRGKSVIFQNAVMEGAPPAFESGKPRGRTACFAGRIVTWKGAGLALDAITLLPDWKLLVCGDGPDRERLERAAREKGIVDRVTFLGRLAQRDLFDLLTSRADVFLYPSMHDDSPLGVAEAISCGLPVVCLDRGGPPVIAGRAGIAVSTVGRSSDVARRLATALEEARVSEGPTNEQVSQLSLDGKYQELVSLLRRNLPQLLEDQTG